jgi:hypothetical protein
VRQRRAQAGRQRGAAASAVVCFDGSGGEDLVAPVVEALATSLAGAVVDPAGLLGLVTDGYRLAHMGRLGGDSGSGLRCLQ